MHFYFLVLSSGLSLQLVIIAHSREVSPDPSDSCWTGLYAALKERCCDQRFSAQGDVGCWDSDQYTFERCCENKQSMTTAPDAWRSWISRNGSFFRWGEYAGTANGRLFRQVMPLFLEPRRQSIKRILEVGFYKGEGALQLLHYLPNSLLVGIDATQFAKDMFESGQLGYLQMQGRVHLVTGSQCDDRTLCAATAIAQGKQQPLQYHPALFDLILDDASHWPPDQICTFRKMFGCVSPGGLYIVADTWTSYWNSDKSDELGRLYDYSYYNSPFGLRSSESASAFFVHLQHFINAGFRFLTGEINSGKELFLAEMQKMLSPDDQELAKHVGSITFGHEHIVITRAFEDPLYPWTDAKPLECSPVRMNCLTQ